jgi:DNA-binding SARP family transcriptional activator/predicted ATPase
LRKDRPVLEVRILGPTEIAVDGARRPLGGPIPRALLVLLALRHGRPVDTDVLVETAWGGKPPPSGRHALSVYLSSLRKTLAPAATIERSGRGFMLIAAKNSEIVVDATTFSTLGEAVAGDLGSVNVEVVRDRVDQALALWRGRPFADLPDSDEWAVESARLEALHREFLHCRAECRVAVADLSGIAELRAFAQQDPYDETTHMRLMRAMYRAGRQQDALDIFSAYARRIRNELGLEPSAAIVGLERAILNHRLGASGGSDRPRRSQPVFGRDQLISDVSTLLTDRARVVTLGGMGGIGKTTVAIGVADRLAEAGRLVTWIPAEELGSGDVPARIAQDLVGRRNVDPFDIGVESETPRLLVVDGFEGHEREAPYLDFLVGALPSLRILLTSRRPTRVAAEWTVQVPPLEAPDDEVSTLGELCASSAGALFAELIDRRALGALDNDHAIRAAADICRRLAGIPLALELAAARVGILSFDELARTLVVASLAGGETIAPAHRSMGYVLDSTVALLSTTGQRLLEAASVFRSWFGAADVATVADLSEQDVETGLRELYDAGLIVRSRDWMGPTRFTVLEPIREHAMESLRAEGREQVTRSRHLEQMSSAVEALAARHIKFGESEQAILQFASMRGDLSEALEYAIANSRVHDAAELAHHATYFWRYISVREGIAWIERLRSLDASQPDRVLLLRSYRPLLHMAGRFDEAVAVSDELLASGEASLYDRLNDIGTRADAGDTRGAIPVLEQIEIEAREAGAVGPIVQALAYLTQSHLTNGDLAAALASAEACETALAEFEVTPLRRGYVRLFQAPPFIEAGDSRRAAELVREVLEIAPAAQDTNATTEGLFLAADLAISHGDAARGRAIAATAYAVRTREGFGLARGDATALPGARLASTIDQPAELTLAEAVEDAHAILDAIASETG